MNVFTKIGGLGKATRTDFTPRSDIPASDTQSAIESVMATATANAAAVADDVAHLVTLSGRPVDSDDLGTFTGSTIPDGSDNKEALQALETAHEALDGDVDALTLVVAGKVASADLASNANGKGASLVGIEDAGGLITATTVEGALAEHRALINALDAAVILKGTWDASSGSFPGSGTAQAGWSYIVSVGGTVDGVVFTANDRILAILDNASTSTYAGNWHKLDYTDQVLSVNTKTGAVTISFDELAPTTTRGDIIARGASGNQRVALGASGKVLTSDGTDVIWSDPSGGVVGEVTLEQFGGAGDGTTDNTSAFNAILSAGHRTIRIGAGKVYKFASAVNTITYGLRIVGSGKAVSVLDFYQTSGQCLYYTGTTDVGGLLEGFTIRNKGANTLTAAVYLQAQAGGGSPDFCVIRDVNITGATNSDLFSYGLLLDGNSRTTGTVGIRNIEVDNVSIFNCTSQSWEVRYGKDVKLRVSCFATGTGGVNSGQITGSGSGTASGVVRLNANMGDLSLGYCASVDCDGIYDDITVSANASSFHLRGVATSVTINASASNGRVAVQSGSSIANSSTSVAVANLRTWQVLASGGTTSSHTGNTSETALATITIPGGTLGANGIVRVTFVLSMTNNANGKTGRVRLGGTSGTSFLAVALASQASFRHQVQIQNRNATNSQVCMADTAASWGVTTAAVITGSRDTTSNQDLVITGQLTNGADTITLESYVVEVCQGP